MVILDRVRRLDADRHHGWRRAGAQLAQFVVALLDQVAGDKVIIRASGLAYATLLATVPLAAVLFAMFSAFASFDDLRGRVQEFLFSQLLPTRQDEIITYLNQFTDNASRMGLFGFIFLVITAILLLDNVETNFNAIWHVTERRRIVAKITAYTSVLVFGTVLIGASLSISARVKAALITGRIPELSFLSKAGAWLFPLLLTFLAFLLMYLVIPFTKVRFKSALVGALVAGVLWESGKNLFANSVGHSVRYSTIYGSLAVIPIFLIWIYITWIIVLLGLELTFTHQHFAALVRQNLYRDTSARDRLSLALKVYAVIAQRFHRGEEPPTASELADRFKVPLEAVDERVVSRLTKAAFVRRVGTGTCDDGLVPTTSLDRVRASDLLRAVLGSPGEAPADCGELEASVDRLVDEFQRAGESAIGGVTIRELVDSAAEQNAR